MGIKSINAFLRRQAAQAFQRLPLLELQSQRIAIDACNWIYTYVPVAHRDVIYAMTDPLEEIDRRNVIQRTIRALVDFIIKLASYRITTVWCWDGNPIPDKEITREVRAKKRQVLLDKIAVARSELEQVHLLARRPEQIQKYKSLLAQHNLISFEEMAHYRSLIELLGIPSLIAEYEGEKLCSELAQENLVAAVWSTDTDAYALGTPVLITGFDGVDSTRQPMVAAVSIPTIRQSLGLTQDQLRDFCIMCGCDFNTNMPNLGPQRCFKLLEKYGSIDALALSEPHRPIHVLNYLRCRFIFKAVSTGLTQSSPKLGFNVSHFNTYSRDVVSQFGIQDSYPELVTVTRYLPHRTERKSRLTYDPEPTPTLEVRDKSEPETSSVPAPIPESKPQDSATT